MFGVLVLGPTLTVVAALALDVDRGRFVRSPAVATSVLYAALTAAWRVVL